MPGSLILFLANR